MVRRKLGNTEYQVSPVAYGGIVSMSDGQKESDRYVKWAMDHGINYYDVAPTYGDAQEKLGNSLRPYRNDVYLACKTEQRGAKGAEEALKESMRLLHTDYFDNYQLHGLVSVAEVETVFGKGGAMEVIMPLHEQGVLRKLGITCHNEDAALRAMELYDFDTVLFPLNWHMNMEYSFGNRVVMTAKARGMGILGMKSLIDRAWINEEEREKSMFPKSWCKPIDADNTPLRVAAMKYALSLGADTLVPPGNFHDFSFAVEHIDECLENPLDEKDITLLKQSLKDVRKYPFFDI
ncbi:MAG: aldo/keto reductase [Lachnospiraceae bacterium]|jgi:predicted aldo/keto reductase-like oxidoreductase|nr:aldo/keto reductase [Lachnospiraceae bacterium]